MLKNRKVTKVVIPVAGLGTRFLPATKTVPKELLPIIDRPIIHYIVKEAVDAGLETVVFVTSCNKISVEDYFDHSDLTSLKLGKVGKEALLEEAFELSRKIDLVSIRQPDPKGLGHAVLQAAPVVAGQSFAVVLGDDIIVSKNAPAIGQCLETFAQQSEGSVVGVLEVPASQTHLYGIVDFDSATQKDIAPRVKGFVEKPEQGHAPSNWALPGRYVFDAGIIDELRLTPPGKNGEIQLTDAMVRHLKNAPFWARKIQGERFDTGDKLGYIMANVRFALEDPKLGVEFNAWLKELVRSRG